MRKQSWTKRDPIKNYFPLPNEIFSLGLSAGAIAVYGYLLRREDRKTYQCLASYRVIGETVGMSISTVRKYVMELEERKLVHTEPTVVQGKSGRPRNGVLLYTILPIQCAVDEFHQRQLQQAELDAQRRRSLERQEGTTTVTPQRPCMSQKLPRQPQTRPQRPARSTRRRK